VELLGETLDERIHRLAVRDAERREQLRQDLEELHHKDRAGAVDAMAMPNKNGRLERCPPKNDGF
jgi:demethoxyubiquinone hydroxylase (CLK1/Coq7/Cat5 family)